MKRFLALLAIPVLLVLAAPVMGADLLLATDLITVNRDGTQDIGDLNIATDGTITFQIDEASTGWRLQETHLYVGDEAPARSRPARFPYKHVRLGGVASDAYVVDFAAADLNCDGVIYVAAQAELVRQIVVNPRIRRPILAHETAWAQGDEPIGRSRATYIAVYLRIG